MGRKKGGKNKASIALEIIKKQEKMEIDRHQENIPIEKRARLSFGYKCLDKLTGGGIPEGTYTTIWGGKGCAKTTIILDLIAKAQKIGKQCIYINGERSYDPIWAKKRVVYVDNLVVVDV